MAVEKPLTGWCYTTAISIIGRFPFTRPRLLLTCNTNENYELRHYLVRNVVKADGPGLDDPSLMLLKRISSYAALLLFIHREINYCRQAAVITEPVCKVQSITGSVRYCRCALRQRADRDGPKQR